MDGPRDGHTEWIKSDKDKYHMILHDWATELMAYMWNLLKKKETETEL